MAIDTTVGPAESDAPHRALRVVPPWLRGYRREWLRRDVIAGVVVWSVVVPQAVAYAQIAGLPPQAGLMAAPGALSARNASQSGVESRTSRFIVPLNGFGMAGSPFVLNCGEPRP